MAIINYWDITVVKVTNLKLSNHKILLAKLYFHGIQGINANWFRSSITNIRQKVETKSPNATL